MSRGSWCSRVICGKDYRCILHYTIMAPRTCAHSCPHLWSSTDNMNIKFKNYYFYASSSIKCTYLFGKVIRKIKHFIHAFTRHILQDRKIAWSMIGGQKSVEHTGQKENTVFMFQFKPWILEQFGWHFWGDNLFDE